MRKKIYYHVKYNVQMTAPGTSDQVKRMKPDLVMESNVHIIADANDTPDDLYMFILSECVNKLNSKYGVFNSKDLYNVHVSMIASFVLN